MTQIETSVRATLLASVIVFFAFGVLLTLVISGLYGLYMLTAWLFG